MYPRSSITTGDRAFLPFPAQGVAVAACESFHDAFADVPPSASRGFVEAFIPYMLARIS
jgi:hypothetical protein